MTRGIMLVAGLVGALLLPTTSASAAGPLGVTMLCESLGGSRIDCETNVSGGVAPYTYVWSLGPQFHGSSASFGCSPGHSVTVTVTVTDSVGSSASTTRSPFCRGGILH